MLADGTGIFLRGDDAVQFGLDGTRAGIIPTQRPVDLAVALSPARVGTTRSELISRIKLAGFPASVAAGIVDDLVAFGVLRTFERLNRVAVLGTSALASELVKLLETSGFRVRWLRDSSAPKDQITGVPPEMPVVVVDQWAHAYPLAPVLKDHFPQTLSVAGLDARGIVGPARIAGEGPCPVCIDLRYAESDPAWTTLTAQTILRWVPSQPDLDHPAPSAERLTPTVEPDPAIRAATAAVAVAQLRAMLNVATPPGERPRVLPGAVIEVNLFGPHRERIIAPHPTCPICSHSSRSLKKRAPRRRATAS